TGNSAMTWVVGLIIPILLAASSVNQRLPSGPAAIPKGLELAVVVAKSAVAWVGGLIIPVLLARISVSQRLPSGPATIDWGLELAVGTGNSAIVDRSSRVSIDSTAGCRRRRATRSRRPSRDQIAGIDRSPRC